MVVPALAPKKRELELEVETLYSPSWYHVAELRPRLSAPLRFHRHVYRGEVWFVLQNPTTARVHRLTPAAYALVRRMNGEESTDELWNAVLEDLGDDAPVSYTHLTLPTIYSV